MDGGRDQDHPILAGTPLTAPTGFTGRLCNRPIAMMEGFTFLPKACEGISMLAKAAQKVTETGTHPSCRMMPGQLVAM